MGRRGGWAAPPSPRSSTAPTGPKILNAGPDDYGEVIRQLDAWWGGRRMADMLPRLFFVHFRDTSFVARVDDEVIGFITGFRSQTFPEQAYVHFAGVAPAWRAGGWGRALYERFFAAASALGCTEVRCVTSPANEGSLAFHARMGFEPQPGDATWKGVPYVGDYDGPGQPRVLLRKVL